ncbi:MAG: phosphosulfolactate synthase [Solirubrobacteraceae bacterium]
MTAARSSFDDYLDGLGVRQLTPATCPFDPGVAPAVLESHLRQSAHLMLSLKISMACWMIADREATRAKLAAARAAGVATNTGGGPYEVAVAQGRLEAYLDLCAETGFDGIECGSGFTDATVGAEEIVSLAAARGLRVEYELGSKHGGAFDAGAVEALLEEGRRWLGAGAHRLVIEARESATAVGLFDEAGALDLTLAQRFADAFGLNLLVFEAPTKPSQFALLDHFGAEARLGNVRLDELLRVEIYRRGLHSDAFSNPDLRPARRT